MPHHMIESPDDPRLDCFRNLNAGPRAAIGRFIAEGEKLVRRLLASPCQVQSIVCNEAALARLEQAIPPGIPVFVAQTRLMTQLVGFRFHRGVLACGARPVAPALAELLDQRASANKSGPLLLTLCPMTNDPENLGLIIRTSAAFGAAAVLVGRAGADPFSRRVLRTSMGAVLDLPIITTSDWHAALAVLHQHAVQTMAAVVCQTAMPLSGTPRHARVALLMGNEDQGLPEELATMCRHRVTLPMTGGVGSLNVAVAAGILLHHFAAGAGEPACQPGAP